MLLDPVLYCSQSHRYTQLFDVSSYQISNIHETYILRMKNSSIMIRRVSVVSHKGEGVNEISSYLRPQNCLEITERPVSTPCLDAKDTTDGCNEVIATHPLTVSNQVLAWFDLQESFDERSSVHLSSDQREAKVSILQTKAEFDDAILGLVSPLVPRSPSIVVHSKLTLWATKAGWPGGKCRLK